MRKEEKLFSIVIPVYNGEDFIQETLNSIFAQTFQSYELIVVDGCSTDRTMEILRQHEDKIDVLISEKDHGMYDALCKGFNRSTGKYMCYINSDDRLLPDTLERVIKKFEEAKHDIVFGDVNYISENGDVIFKYKGINFSARAIESIKRVPFAQQSSFWTREIYNKVGGFDSSLKYVADSKFLLSICLDPEVKKGYVNAPLGEYRMRQNSFSVSATGEMREEHVLMLNQLKLNKLPIQKTYNELFTKLVNMKGIYNRMTYRGVKF